MAGHAARGQIEVLLQKSLMHIIEMIECHHRCFQQRRAGHPIREIALGKLLRGDEQVVEGAELIDQTAWQCLRLDTDRADHFAAAQAFLGPGLVFHLQIQANRGVRKHAGKRGQQPGGQTVGVDRQR